MYSDRSIQDKHTENLPKIIQDFPSDRGSMDWQVVFRSKPFQIFMFTLSFLFSLPGTDNESLEQNFSDLLIFLCGFGTILTYSQAHTYAYKRSQQNHTGEPSFWTDTVVGSIGQQKKKPNKKRRVYRWWKSAWTCPGACSLTKSVHTPPLPVQLARNALQCMQDCARGLLFNDRLIYIYFKYKCTPTVNSVL